MDPLKIAGVLWAKTRPGQPEGGITTGLGKIPIEVNQAAMPAP